MVHKTKEIRKQQIKAEKYILILLIISYIIGMCSGCYFVLSSETNALFTSYITTNNVINTALFFILAILLKYSGILSGILYILPFFSGVQNSAYYCNIILNNENTLHSIIFDILKDTAILLLLILYIVVIISQIINKRYNSKKDLKYLSVYFSGVITIYIIYNAIRFIF